MTVKELLNTYFEMTCPKITASVVQANYGDGILHHLHSGYPNTMYMRPEVMGMTVKSWGINLKANHIWITV